MSSTSSERGHAKNEAFFEQAIAIAEAMGSNYQPSNPRIQLAALLTKQTESKSCSDTLRKVTAQYEDLTNGREILFKQVIPLSMRVVGYLKSLGLPKQTIEDAMVYIRLMRGRRAGTKPKKGEGDKENVEEAEGSLQAPTQDEPKTISVSHTGYHNMANHFANLLELIKNQPLYAPLEQDITVAALQAFSDELHAMNSQEAVLGTQKQMAFINRNECMYHVETGLPNLLTEMKAYVLAVLGTKAPQLKELRKLKIVNMAR